MGTFRAAVVQAGSVPFDPRLRAQGGRPDPRGGGAGGADRGVPRSLPRPLPQGRVVRHAGRNAQGGGPRDFAAYHRAAIDLDGPELALVAEAAAETGMVVVIGCIERDGGTLYCTALFLDGAKGLVGTHRKLMPTGAERLIWGFGDGSTLTVIDTALGRVGAVICWENYMPMMRMAMYDKGVALYCAPTADDRDTWLPTMRHVALEGRCFVLSACQHIRRGAYPADYDCALGDDPDTVLMRGGSCIVDPLGNVLAGPDFEGETILYADIDDEAIVRGKY